MANGHNSGREQGRVRRGLAANRNRARSRRLVWEAGLEERALLYADGFFPTSTDVADVRNGPLANAGQLLITAYRDYLAFQNNPVGEFQTSASGLIKIDGTRAQVNVIANNPGGADYAQLVRDLRNLGVDVRYQDAARGYVNGWASLGVLPTIAASPRVASVTPEYRPFTNQQGSANNQADDVFFAGPRGDQVRAALGISGEGLEIGVLSDSADTFAGGLADSYGTGDLAPGSVTVVADVDGSDEGRAMMELMHDIAPGATYSFFTAFQGYQQFADGILSLATRGADIIVDDISNLNNPYFQDGLTARSVNTVTNQGIPYLSSIGNHTNAGYESAFRSANRAATGGLPAGTFHDFDPGAGVVTELTLSSPAGSRAVAFQWDNPWDGVAGSVTTDMAFYIINAGTGAVTTIDTNNIQTRQPLESFILPAGDYRVAMRAVAGDAPTRVRFSGINSGTGLPGFAVNPTGAIQFGAETTFPAAFSAAQAVAGIAVGAVNFYEAPPFVPDPLISADFSSAGPVTRVFDANGTRLPQPVRLLKPEVSAPQAGNTSFFGQDIPEDADTLPNFFGTSAAAPNLAALIALMKDLNPSASLGEIRTALFDSVVFLSNNTEPGTTTDTQGRAWNPRGGYGRVVAEAALTAIDQLRISATTPEDDEVVTTAPAFIDVTFSRPINPATLQAGDLVFTPDTATVPGTPPGVDVAVGTPFALPGVPNRFRFPITISFDATATTANGRYEYTFNDNSVASLDGRGLVGETRQFRLNDTLGPRVTNVTSGSRRIQFTFSEPIRPGAINFSTIRLLRNGTPINLSAGATLAIDPSDPNQTRFTLDLTGLPQNLLTSGTYVLQILDVLPGGGVGVTDLVGNLLDGEFFGAFPSGNGTPGGAFERNLGINNGPLTLTAPAVTFFGLEPTSDSGIIGDENTNVRRPAFIGQVRSDFLGQVSNVLVVVQINSRQPNQQLTLAVGNGGRGVVGTTPTDLTATTDVNGQFRITLPADLPEGFSIIRVAVIGQQDNPALPGLSSLTSASVRTDYSQPLINPNTVQVNGAPVAAGITTNLNALSTVSLDVIDPVRFANPNLAVPTTLDYLALDPNSANNITNYRLVRTALANGTPTNVDPGNPSDPNNFSRFINTVVFSRTTIRNQPSDPYTGRLDFNFQTGLPAGQYQLIALTNLLDSAGNGFDQDPNTAGSQPFALNFAINEQPLFIRGISLLTLADPAGPTDPANVIAVAGPRSFFELPAAGSVPRADAPPTVIRIDFSERLAPFAPQAIRLIRSADAVGEIVDGDFGVNGVSRFIAVPTTIPVVTDLANGGSRVEIRVQAPLVADYYRIVIGNRLEEGSEIRDVFGNLLDGELLGNDTGILKTDEFVNLPDLPLFETFLPNGQRRIDSFTGDLVEGGSMTTGFVVVPNGNVINARPDYVDNPNITLDDPDGSPERPYATLGPEAFSNAASNFGTGFRPGINPGQKDLNGNGRFDRSAFIAARDRVELNGGPVVIIARPAAPARDPITGAITQRPYVFQAPSALGADGSASVPEGTILALQPGVTLKMRNSSLFVQNQGSAIQFLGAQDAGQQVTVTSFADDNPALGGDTNGDGNLTQPRGGDWGGVVLRNYDDFSAGRVGLPGRFPIDNKLGLSGADDTMSIINYGVLRYGGGAVPQTIGFRYDTIFLANSRPAITNTAIFDTGANGTAQAAISADMDSLREDFITRGPLIRNVTFVNNSLNGVWVRPEENGIAQQTDAIFYADNPIGAGFGSARNFVIDDPVPYLFLSQVQVGTAFVQNTGGSTTTAINRLYVQPGMLLKFQRGSGLVVNNVPDSLIRPDTRNASLIIGDRQYVSGIDGFGGFDETADNFVPFSYRPLIPDDPTDPGSYAENPNFTRGRTGDSKVILTSLYDDLSTTVFVDPVTGVVTTVIPRNDADNANDVDLVTGTQRPNAPRFQPKFPNEVTLPAATNLSGRWGGIQLVSGSRSVIDESQFLYTGGELNQSGGTLPVNPAIAFVGATGITSEAGGQGQARGARVSITNNDFLDSLDAPLTITPNGLLAGDPLTPLLSGNPFFRGNVFQRNRYDGLRVLPASTARAAGVGITDVAVDFLYNPNLDVDSTWDDSDLTYILRGTVIVNGYNGGIGDPIQDPLRRFSLRLPDPINPLEEVRPYATLTIASQLPDTLLADGTRVARPGESVIVKLATDDGFPVFGNGITGMGNAGNPAIDHQGGAGFMVGFDDNTDPIPDPFYDGGLAGSIRILGIPGNETVDQPRVPVVLTSLFDNTFGRTVRGVSMFDTTPLDAVRAAAAGDGGIIGYGAHSMWDYNLLDPRNGNLIDNADIRFMTRIEMQAGGLVDAYNLDPINAGYDLLDAPGSQRYGNNFAGNQVNQNNLSKGLTISNSNLDAFSQVGVVVQPGFNKLIRDVGQVIDTVPITNGPRVGFRGPANNLFMVNNIISNAPIGVSLVSDGAAGFQGATADQTPSPTNAVFLNNTFYGNPIGIRSVGGDPASTPVTSSVHMFAMNNIFAAYSTAAVVAGGRQTGSQLQYNLFDSAANQVLALAGAPAPTGPGNSLPIIGNPSFRDAANGDFFLREDSAAIDASRSEIGPISFGNLLRPASRQILTEGFIGGLRDTSLATAGLQGLFTVLGTDFVVLPGRGQPLRTFFDQWVAALPESLGGTGDAFFGTAGNAGTSGYLPSDTERDQLGFQRIDNPGRPNLGFGSRPFFDLGAREYRELFPPQIINVSEDVAVRGVVLDQDGLPEEIELYSIGTLPVGTNRVPQAVQLRFNSRLDPASINNLTVRLQASGGDGIFGNGNTADDRFIDLSGNLAFDQLTQILTISLGSFQLGSDLYRIAIAGTGSDVIRDQQGVALDGENRGPQNEQLGLPTGDGLPGGNFSFEFTIDTTAPSFVGPPITLDPGTDSSLNTDRITNNTTPTFTGQVRDVFPPLNPNIDQTVVLEVSLNGTGAYQAVGVGISDAQGNFRVTVGQYARLRPPVAITSLPDSEVNVGANGILEAGDVGSHLARVRVIDTSGNQTVSAPISFIVDTQRPSLLSSIPQPNVQATLVNGTLELTIVADENLDLASVAAGVSLVRSGGDGVFGTGGPSPDVAVTLGAPLTVSYQPFTGVHTIRIPVSGQLTNDLYQFQINGTGAAVADVAGNALDPATSPGFPSSGGNILIPVVIFDPSFIRGIWVDDNAGFGGSGTRANPFRTINQALNTALIGDVIKVLPGVYNESIVLRSLVQIVSAAESSTDSNLIPGRQLDHLIRAPQTLGGSATTVTGANLLSIAGFPTRLSGFTIAAPLVLSGTGQVTGTNPVISLTNAEMLLDRNYIINGGTGVAITTTGDLAGTPDLFANVIVGNTVGVSISEGANSIANPVNLINNTIALNTIGLSASGGSNVATAALVINNIFWNNHSVATPGTPRTGAAIVAGTANKLVVRNNLFFNNGISDADYTDETVGVGGAFDPAALGSTPDDNGNFVGNPVFAVPRDPRPEANGTAIFLNSANYDLTSTSAAIDNANSDFAPSRDFLNRPRIDLPGRGFFGLGPADLGAFEFTTLQPPPTTTFRVTGMSPTGRVTTAPRVLTINFSAAINRSTLTASDFVLSGNGVARSNGVRVSQVSFLSDNSVRLTLTGAYNRRGTVRVSLATNAAQSAAGGQLEAFAGQFTFTRRPNGAGRPRPRGGNGNNRPRVGAAAIGNNANLGFGPGQGGFRTR